MVNAPNREVQIHQPDVRDSPLHRDDFYIDYERKFEPCETVVEHRTGKTISHTTWQNSNTPQIPLGFGNAVVLQTMLSESLRESSQSSLYLLLQLLSWPIYPVSRVDFSPKARTVDYFTSPRVRDGSGNGFRATVQRCWSSTRSCSSCWASLTPSLDVGRWCGDLVGDLPVDSR